ncbi:MAG: aminotransferase class I/II-fold pyridoxal phosphate-dependent enzyme [Caldilineaceae bacterium]
MQGIAEFKLERYFGKYEFAVQWLLSPSDCESVTVPELVALADPESRQLWDSLHLGYTESPGHPLLRAAITRMYQQVGPEGIVVAAPEELIFIAMHSLLQPDDHIIYTAPAYQSLYAVAQSIGCAATPWYLQAKDGYWVLDIDQLERLVTQRTKVLVINFPHNPTGYIPSQADLLRIVEFARAHGLYLFSDEMYRLLEHDESLRLPPLCDLYERAITLSGVSKTFGLPGLRIGWLATQQTDLPPRWLMLKDYTTICNSAPSEILALMGLRAGDQLAQRNLAIVRENLRASEAFCARHANLIQWLRPQGGSTAFPCWLGSEPLDALCQRALEEQGLMIVPGAMFDLPGNHFRIGLGRRNLPQVLEHFDQLITR